MTNFILNGFILNELKDIKVIFERIEKDKKNIKVSILWKQDSEIRDIDNVSVYVEVGGSNNRSLKLQRLENSDIWYTTLKITNSLNEIAYFDKKLAVKLVQYRVKNYKSSYSYAF
jgi:hypothetical protein